MRNRCFVRAKEILKSNAELYKKENWTDLLRNAILNIIQCELAMDDCQGAVSSTLSLLEKTGEDANCDDNLVRRRRKV